MKVKTVGMNVNTNNVNVTFVELGIAVEKIGMTKATAAMD